MSVPTESLFGNMSQNWLYFRSLSILLIPYLVFQTNPIGPTKHPRAMTSKVRHNQRGSAISDGLVYVVAKSCLRGAYCSSSWFP